MFLKTLYLKDFRLFSEQRFSFSPSCNIFYGDNGVGKTSLLEAIGFLGRGKSFRTTSTKKLIHINKSKCAIAGEVTKNKGLHRLSIEIHQSLGRRFQLNGQPIKSILDLAELLPLLWINFYNLHLFLATPSLRRQVLDWGVFHVMNDFYVTWRNFNKVLQQRNSALKQQQSDRQICCWDKDLVAYAQLLDRMRQQYIHDISAIALPHLAEFLVKKDIFFEYNRGWEKHVALDEVLIMALKNDRRLGYTQFGPHRADIQLFVENKPAEDFCSQGQHKVISYIFYLMQAKLFSRAHTTTPLLLIDDLPSELDGHKIASIAPLLRELNGQIFISGIEKQDFNAFCSVFDEPCMFHVKQ
jgi:DNA replication and repair protein RecF